MVYYHRKFSNNRVPELLKQQVGGLIKIREGWISLKEKAGIK